MSEEQKPQKKPRVSSPASNPHPHGKPPILDAEGNCAICGEALDPATGPVPAKMPAFENREELPLVDVEPVDPSPAKEPDE